MVTSRVAAASAKLESPKSNSKGRTLAHLNVRSLLPKVAELQCVLSTCDIDVLSLSETLLTNDISGESLSVPGYKLYRNDRGSRHGGGVAVYVKETVPHTFLTDAQCNSEVEVCWVKMHESSKKSTRVCTVYRTPSADYKYFENLIDNIERVYADDDFNLIIMGDLNYDYKYDESLSSNPVHFMENLFVCNQLIESPTRVTPASTSLLDVILTNEPDNHVKSGVVPCTLSDHYMVYTVVTCHQTKVPPRTVTCRDYKRFNLDVFLCDFNHCLSSFLDVDVDTAWARSKNI